MMHNGFATILLLAALLADNPASAQDRRPIVFEVWVPAGATLVIDGFRTLSTGEKRTFETPPVPTDGAHVYTVKVIQGDRELVRTLRFTPEGTRTFDLRAEFAASKSVKQPGGEEASELRPGLSRGPEKAGFRTFVEDGRLWVFHEDAAELSAWLKDGTLARHVIRPGVGPEGMSIKAPDGETVVDYLLGVDGFVTVLEPDASRLWVFRKGSKELEDFRKEGPPARYVSRLREEPMGMTIKAPDFETMDAYLKGLRK
jgi:uncharacterized protein (TIGR03000 family)